MDNIKGDYNWRFLIYYLVLAAYVFLLMKPNANPPMLIRIGLLGLIFGPAIITNVRFIPTLFVMFVGADIVSFTHVLPSTHFYFLLIAVLCYVVYTKKTYFGIKGLAALSYYFICAFSHSDVRDCFTFFLMAILLSDMVRDKEDISLLLFGYLCMSIFLELLFFVHGDAFLQVYADSGGMERVGWTNPNVFGGAIAGGGVLAVAYLTDVLKLRKTKVLTYLCIGTAIMTFIVLALNASRGALFAFVIPSALMIITTKMKWYIKLLLAVAAGALIYYVATSSAFEIMMMRLEGESMGDVGGRSLIWEDKLNAYMHDLSPFEQIFGIGQLNIQHLGTIHFSTHNDFISSLIAYGIIGFVLCVYYIVIVPFKSAGKGNRITILLLLLYLYIECCVLEPLFRGYFGIIMYFFFVLKYAMINKTDRKITSIK